MTRFHQKQLSQVFTHLGRLPSIHCAGRHLNGKLIGTENALHRVSAKGTHRYGMLFLFQVHKNMDKLLRLSTLANTMACLESNLS